MENMTEKASQKLDEIKFAADEIKVAVETGVTATKPDILVISGHWLNVTDGDAGDDFKEKAGRNLEIWGLRGLGRCLRMHTPVKTLKGFTDKDYVKMESGGMIEEVVNKCWWKRKCNGYVGYANDYIEKIVKPKMAILFLGAAMQNIYQLGTSEMVITGKGKTLMKLNKAAFMMLLYGLVMPRHAAGHVALAIGVALASAAYLFTMSFTF